MLYFLGVRPSPLKEKRHSVAEMRPLHGPRRMAALPGGALAHCGSRKSIRVLPDLRQVQYIPRYDMTIAVQTRVVPRDGRVNFIKSVLEHVLNLEG